MTIGSTERDAVTAVRQREAARRHVEACIRVLHSTGWEQWLARLAEHMASKHLVRTRTAVGAPMRWCGPAAQSAHPYAASTSQCSGRR